ncbi:MAG TPA: hypothetical protein VK968_18170 [Roseimicrobium sp.]|nr:hypothetical protein [Roseimicrobium sp.]
MKSIGLLFMLCGALVRAEPAGATDLVPPDFNPAGDKVKNQGTEPKSVVTLRMQPLLMDYTPPASPEIINTTDAFTSSLKTTPP